MFGLGVFALILGYSMVYTGVSNLLNGGNGPKLFEAMGITNTLSSPASNRVGQGGGNQVGPVPSTPLPSPGIIGGPMQVTNL